MMGMFITQPLGHFAYIHFFVLQHPLRLPHPDIYEEIKYSHAKQGRKPHF